MITRLAISGYRSLLDVRLELDQLNVVTGPNGSGKSSLYRALRLLADIAQGRIVQSLAMEGGLESTLWAGPEALSRAMKRGDVKVEGGPRKHPVALKLGFADEDYGYAIDLGLPVPDSRSSFGHDAAIKAEAVWIGERLAPRNAIAERKGPSVRVRGEDGAWGHVLTDLLPVDSMMTHASDPRNARELLILRDRMRAWRFYDHLRTDRDAPARQPQIGTFTPVMSGDGADLAASVVTIAEAGSEEDFREAVDDAFPGARVGADIRGSYFAVEMWQPGMLRPLVVSELSDGTLRYLMLVAALLTPRPPALMILNEPETSLHPDLLAPLARLILAASKRSQIVVVSHAEALVTRLVEHEGCRHIALRKELGETVIADVGPLETPSWTWPAR